MQTNKFDQTRLRQMIIVDEEKPDQTYYVGRPSSHFLLIHKKDNRVRPAERNNIENVNWYQENQKKRQVVISRCVEQGCKTVALLARLFIAISRKTPSRSERLCHI